MARGDVITTIRAVDRTGPGLASARAGVASFGRMAAASTTGVITGTIVSQTAFAAVRALQDEIRAGFDFTLEQERLNLQLSFLVDSVADAQKFIKSFSAETPFLLTDVANAFKVTATIIGGSSDEIEEHVRRFSDAFAIFGSGTSADMQRFSVHYARVVNQLQNGNNDILESLNELRDNGFIKLRDEINRLAKAGDHDTALALFLQDLERAKGGAAELSQTTVGLISTYQGLKEQLSGLVAENALPTLRLILKSVNEEMQEAVDYFEGKDVDAEGNLFVRIGESVEWALRMLRAFNDDFAVMSARIGGLGDADVSTMDRLIPGRELYLRFQAAGAAAEAERQRIADRNHREFIEELEYERRRREGGGRRGGGTTTRTPRPSPTVAPTGMQPADYLGYTGSGLGPRGQPADYGRTAIPFIRATRPDVGHAMSLPDISDKLTVANEDAVAIGDVAHRDAQDALRVAQQIMSGVDAVAAGLQKGGTGGFFQSIGGVLGTIGQLALLANPATAWALPLAIAGTGAAAAGRYLPGAGGDRSPARQGGYGPQGGIQVNTSVYLEDDAIANAVGNARLYS